jgi:hypothetical protein
MKISSGKTTTATMIVTWPAPRDLVSGGRELSLDPPTIVWCCG